MNKKVIISGGSRGIGRACVELFAERGHSVAFIYKDNDEKAEECARTTGAIAIKADLSDPSGARYAADTAIRSLGGVDILINNAGISYTGLISDMTDEEWRSITDTNISSAFYLCRDLSKHMVHNKSGCIINIGSVWGRCGASCEVAYSATKSAIRGLTLSLAKELGPSGIRVNCVEPGVISTDMNACHSEDTMELLSDETPLMRIGEPIDVARAVYFLSCDEASFITGQILGVDGGFGL